MPNRHTRKRRNAMTPDPNDHLAWKLLALIHNHTPWLYAGGAAMVTAALRTYLDTGKITGRDVCEWIICGMFVASSKPAWGVLGMGDEYGAFIGVIVGMLGARVLRVIAESALGKFVERIGGKGRKDK